MILGPVIVGLLCVVGSREMDTPEAMILGALCVAPRETLSEAQLQRITNLSDQELSAALDRLQHRVKRGSGRVTLR